MLYVFCGGYFLLFGVFWILWFLFNYNGLEIFFCFWGLVMWVCFSIVILIIFREFMCVVGFLLFLILFLMIFFELWCFLLEFWFFWCWLLWLFCYCFFVLRKYLFFIFVVLWNWFLVSFECYLCFFLLIFGWYLNSDLYFEIGFFCGGRFKFVLIIRYNKWSECYVICC